MEEDDTACARRVILTCSVNMTHTVASMTRDDLLWTHRPPARRRDRNPGELLFEFHRSRDRTPMSCELRFNGESYGWEVQFFVRGEFVYSHGAFVTREVAIAWAERERDANLQ